MAGVTDRAYRRLVTRFGPGLMFTEMVSAMAITYRNRRTLEMLELAPDEGPTAIQLFGHLPEVMAEAAVVAAGFHPVAIDINMGCPTPKVVKNGDGAALLLQPDLCGEIVRAVTRAVAPLPVTVKIRKGWDEQHVTALEVAIAVAEAGAAAVTVHGRTREMFYTGRADWEIIRQVKESVDIPVIGNGDVTTPEGAAAMLRETGCDAVMIGRGALGNPWLVQRVDHYLKTGELLPEPSLEEKVLMAVEHLHLLVAEKGEEIGVPEMRKHASWYLRGVRGANRIREGLHHARTMAEMESLLRSLLPE